MILLDYTLPRSSRYMLFIDAPFRYSWRHLIQYFTSNIVRKQTGLELLTPTEKAVHFGLAFLEVLPVLGIAVALLDRLFFSKKRGIVTTYSKRDITTAGFLLEKIVPIYCKIFGGDAKKQALAQEPYILPRYIEEMKNLARITGTHFEDVLAANTILDRLTLFGGSIKAENSSATKIATNYFHSQGRDSSVADVYKSFWRFDKLSQAVVEGKKALLQVCMQETIASCIYDGTRQKLLWAFGSDNSANRPYKSYNLKKLFKTNHNVLLLQNIDFPMGLLAPFTRLFVREPTSLYSFVSVGWLGIVGCYSGINEHGLAVAACSVPANTSKTKKGTPVHLIIRQILEEAKTTEEAKVIIQKAIPASSMNLIIATEQTLIRIEFGR